VSVFSVFVRQSFGFSAWLFCLAFLLGFSVV
jgi:hypothetical protein